MLHKKTRNVRSAGSPGLRRPKFRIRGVCVYYCSTYNKAVRVRGGDFLGCVCLLLQYLLQSFSRVCGRGNNGGHVLRETTSRGLCGLVCPSRTSERGGEGYSVNEGGGEEGSVRGSVQGRKVRLHYSLGYSG